ncbi:diacylglycerol kinase [Agrobacterium tumefaciens]|uniref:diacylglycerol kinase n=1 Tax=Agrobacterium tumefaciens TaxID=358 RepID=UPI00287CBF85|nr:diacylglycerol kinase [Agrobacterium tumefaciens]MDS7597357.1 diacylglycerol kinase [Agrobacterium tumefaciens]
MDAMSQPPEQGPVFRKEKGLRHLFAAARYSAQGLQRLWQEAAFRHEVLAFGAGLVLLALVGAPLVHYLVFALLMLLLFAVEALNTAIEEVIDRISPERSSVGRHAKDLGSFAVFCLLVANGLFMLYSLTVSLFF